MKNTFRISLYASLIMITLISFSQPPGGRRNGGGPEEMVKREKQTLYKKITDLSEDQKLLLDGIYDEFTITLKESIEELRASNDREGRREKMLALRKEKDDLVKDVLNEEQYKIYTSIRAPRRGLRNQEGNPNGDGQ
ncbi:hypothetical protein [Ekhidna sp.]